MIVQVAAITHTNESLTINVATLRHIVYLAGLSFEDFFPEVAMESAKLVGADGAALILQDNDGMMRYQFFSGVPSHFKRSMQDYRFNPYEGTVGQALKLRQPIYTTNYAHSPYAMPELVQAGLLANLIIPIDSGDESPTVAVLAISWFKSSPKQAPTLGQLEIIGLYSDFLQAGLARQAKMDAWRLQASRDALTGLSNRRSMLNYLPAALDRAQRNKTQVVVCVMDLNLFKPVNDTYGHAAGDVLLMELAYRLKTVMRTTDLIARLGGDEFVAVLESITSDEQMLTALNRIHQVAIEPYYLRDHQPVRIGMSMGVTIFPDDNVDTDGLLRHADQALYLAKAHKSEPGNFWYRWQA